MLAGCFGIQSGGKPFFGRAEAALGRLTLVSIVSSMTKLLVDSVGEHETYLYGCFSPHGRSCLSSSLIVSVVSSSEATVEVEALVLQIIPELQVLCGEPASPLSMVLLEADSLETSSPTPPPSDPSKSLVIVECGDLHDVVFHLLWSIVKCGS